MADQQDVLAKPLPEPAVPSGKGRVGFKEAMGIEQPYLTRKAELQPEIAKAEGDIAKGQQEQKEIKSTGELSAQMRFGQQQEEAMQGYQEKLEKEPLPAFIPSKDTAQDIAGLFGVISVISMLVGGGGRMSGQLALGNMNGMMEGYRKGRKDLYEKERSEFDKNFKSMIQKHAEFRQEMDDAVKLAATNKEEGFRAAEMAAVKAGSPIVQAQLRKGDLLGAYKLVDESQKGSEHALQMEAKAREQEEAQKFRKEQAKQAADLRRDLAGMKAKGGQTSALLQGRAENIREAFVQAATDIVNITKFPPNTMLGTFAGLTGASAEGITSGIRNAIARGVTDKEQRMLESLLSGIEGQMSFALGGGYASSQSKARMDQYKAQIARAGDDPAQVPLMLARFRQEMNILADNFESKPGATPAMNDAIQKANNSINQAVPFTVDDVLSAELGEKKSSTPAPKPKGSGTKDDPIKLD